MLNGHLVCLTTPEAMGPGNKGEQSKNTQVTQVRHGSASSRPLPLEVDLEGDLESPVAFR